MSLDHVRRFCMALPHTTETVQWGNDLVFKVGGKMYAVAGLEPGPHCLSFKCAEDEFADLLERPGVAPAPYLARAHWVALESWDAVPRRELEALLRKAYDIVFAKLTRSARAELAAAPKPAKRPKSRR